MAPPPANSYLFDEDISGKYPARLRAILRDVRSAYNQAVALNTSLKSGRTVQTTDAEREGRSSKVTVTSGDPKPSHISAGNYIIPDSPDSRGDPRWSPRSTPGPGDDRTGKFRPRPPRGAQGRAGVRPAEDRRAQFIQAGRRGGYRSTPTLSLDRQAETKRRSRGPLSSSTGLSSSGKVRRMNTFSTMAASTRRPDASGHHRKGGSTLRQQYNPRPSRRRLRPSTAGNVRHVNVDNEGGEVTGHGPTGEGKAAAAADDDNVDEDGQAGMTGGGRGRGRHRAPPGRGTPDRGTRGTLSSSRSRFHRATSAGGARQESGMTSKAGTKSNLGESLPLSTQKRGKMVRQSTWTAESMSRLSKHSVTLSGGGSHHNSSGNGDDRLFRNYHGLSPDTSVLVVHRNSQSREAWNSLERRGWFLNQSNNTEMFDMLWTVGSASVPWNQLRPNQRVNHFQGNGALTTKAGLSESLSNLKWLCDVDINEFFPECYDLGISEQKQDFLERFQLSAAEAVLKMFLDPRPLPTANHAGEEEDDDDDDYTDDDGDDDDDDDDDDDSDEYYSDENDNDDSAEEEEEDEDEQGDDDVGQPAVGPSLDAVRAALRICGALLSKQGYTDDETELGFGNNVSKSQEERIVEILRSDALFYRVADISDMDWNLVLNNEMFPVRRKATGRSERALARTVHGTAASTGILLSLQSDVPISQRKSKKIKSRIIEHYQRLSRSSTSDETTASVTRLAVWNVDQLGEEQLRKLTHTALQHIEQRYPFQYHLNTSRNLWIVKPAGKSRGRGIDSFCNIRDVLSYCGAREEHWIAQKYIENALVVKGRKFDIRQWVLVTSYNPLTIYFYDRCYLRFCTAGFTLDNMDDKYLHLANHAVQEHGDEFGADPEFPGNMWSGEEMRAYLKEQYGSEERWTDVIQPSMEDQIIKSLLSAKDKIPYNKSAFELFGYDFMIDDRWRVYLIEINENPSLEQSTPITKELVPLALEHLVGVVVDHDRDPKATQIGHWRQIYHEKKPPTCQSGVDLLVQGHKVNIPRSIGKRE